MSTSATAVATNPRVEMIDISQTFGEVTVLHDVSISLRPGEVHALVGQNGAGKSTLMKILGGIYTSHRGSIKIDGETVHVTSPRGAAKLGIGMIYQELSLIPTLSVAENIMLGQEPGAVRYSRREILERAREITESVPMFSVLPLETPVGQLSTGLQQRVEAAKALARNARVLVMDEPTARLSGPEREALKDLIRELSASGISVIYISHFLEEIFEVCDSATVLRNGRIVEVGEISSFTVPTMTRAMLNAELAREEQEFGRGDREFTEGPVLELVDVSGPRTSGISLAVRPGEVVGLVGLVGSGRTRVCETIVGAQPTHGGEVRVRGRRVKMRDPRAALKQGIVMLPENRKTDGIIGTLSATFNMIGQALDRGMSRAGFIRRRAQRSATTRMFENLEIRPVLPGLDGQWFSGGNQQKILLARTMLAKPSLIVADQPTAGVDVGTKAQIHRIIREMSADGTAFVVATDDLEEVLVLCDKVYVMKNGRIIAEYLRSELDHSLLVAAIAGDAEGIMLRDHNN